MNGQQTLKVIDEQRAAEIMGRKVQTLRNDRHLRKGVPYLKIGRSVRYLMSDIDEFLRKNRIDPEAA